MVALGHPDRDQPGLAAVLRAVPAGGAVRQQRHWTGWRLFAGRLQGPAGGFTIPGGLRQHADPGPGGHHLHRAGGRAVCLHGGALRLPGQGGADVGAEVAAGAAAHRVGRGAAAVRRVFRPDAQLPVAVDRAHRHHRAVRAAFNTDPADAGAARAGRGFRGPGRQPLDHVLPGGAAADPAGHRDRFHLRVHLVMDQRGAFHLQHHGGPEHHPREAFQLRAVHDRSDHRSRIGRHDRGCGDRHRHS
ncbi:hypothetical protein G6F57_015679 [Rhizopus arrhizus]|nr:hypothetical protein G6F57_015679 [Rhizopus arrhizus]